MANIRTARRSGLVLRGGRNVRDTVWADLPLISSSLGTTGSAVLTTALNAAGLALRPFTVIRERIMIYVTSDQEAASEAQNCAFGACVVTEQAVAIGVTAVPTPVTDLSSDLWYAHRWCMSSHGAGTVDSQRGQPYELDSKAMRKVETGQDLITVVENGSNGGVIMAVAGRSLFKLH